MRYAPSLAALVALSALLAGCPREPDDTGDTGDTDTGDTDTGDTDSGDTDTDSGDTDSGDTDSGDTSDTSDTGTGPTDRLLMITEIVDGDMFSAEDTDTNTSNGPFDRVPRFVEITNVGDTTEDLSQFTLALWRNGGKNNDGDLVMEAIPLSGTVAPGDSFVVSIENELEGVGVTGFFQVYGVEPDLQVKKSGHNGDDAYSIYFGAASGDGSNATLIDTFGVIGEDGTDKDWEYSDGFGCRTFNDTVVPVATFALGEWTIMEDVLRVGGAYADNAAELPLVLAYTSPGEWDATSCPPAGPECTEATDCPMPDSPCMEAVCNPDLTCGEQPIGEGPLPDTTPGDCKTPACDASGNETVANADDPLADTFCVDNTCVDGTPTPVPQNEGNPLPGDDQEAGDCQVLVCESGAPVSQDDNDDEPAQNECINPTCVDGVPDFTDFVPGGTALPGDEQTDGDCFELYCDNDHVVQSRVDQADEPTDLDCEEYACDTDGTLLTTHPGNAKVLTDTEPGDCHDLVCKEGENATEELVNDQDLPADTECSLGDCADGVPTPLYSDEGDACLNDPGVCSADHECVECISDAQCGGITGACDTDLNTCRPTVIDTTPANDVVDACIHDQIVVEFSRAMDPTTLTAQTADGACTGSIQLSTDDFVSCLGFAAAAPTMSEGDTVATLRPAVPLTKAEYYDLKVTAAAESADGSALASDVLAASFITADAGVVMSQVYGAGGNSGATYNKDFIELYNQCNTPVSLAGWSMQYTSSTGPSTGNSWSRTSLSGTIAAHGYFLVTQAGGSNGSPLPQIDLEITSSPLALSGTGGKIAVFASNPTITTACPTHPSVVDFLPFGTSATNTCTEGTGNTANISTTTSAHRNFSGCKETNVTGDDFTVATVLPRASTSPKAYCSSTDDIVANGDGAGTFEADYCKLVSPTTLAVTRNTASGLITGEIYESPWTDGQIGPVEGYKAQVGYGPLASDPTGQVSWVFFDAPFDSEIDNNDIYKGSIVAPVVANATPTDFAYTIRFGIPDAGGDIGWTYCDTDGAGSNATLLFEPTKLGTMTVNP